MGTAKPEPRLDQLRQTLAALDPSLVGFAGEANRLALGVPALDAALGGGLARGALHEFAPAAPIHLAAATGTMAALTALANRKRGQALWIATDFAVCEGGGPYGPGLDLFGMAADRLVMLRVPRAVDALWAMEEALRCRALGSVIAELTDDGSDADLTATRRLTLAAREGGSLGLLLRHRATSAPSAAMTRWRIAAAPSQPDRFGGLGPATFDLALQKNRRGPCGRWFVTWSHHECQFHAAVSLAVAAAAVDRSDRTPSVHAG